LLLEIEHHEPMLRVVMITTTSTGETRNTLDLTTDGKPVPESLNGRSCTASAAWGPWRQTRLVIEVHCPDGVSTRRLTLGAKGRILTTVLTVTNQSGEKKAYEFFRKQGV
jgi:hypothetical protein